MRKIYRSKKSKLQNPEETHTYKNNAVLSGKDLINNFSYTRWTNYTYKIVDHVDEIIESDGSGEEYLSEGINISVTSASIMQGNIRLKLVFRMLLRFIGCTVARSCKTLPTLPIRGINVPSVVLRVTIDSPVAFQANSVAFVYPTNDLISACYQAIWQKTDGRSVWPSNYFRFKLIH